MLKPNVNFRCAVAASTWEARSKNTFNWAYTPGKRAPNEAVEKDLKFYAQQLSEHEAYDAMRTGVEDNQTFTQTLRDFNRRASGSDQNIDVNEEGADVFQA